MFAFPRRHLLFLVALCFGPNMSHLVVYFDLMYKGQTAPLISSNYPAYMPHSYAIPSARAENSREWAETLSRQLAGSGVVADTSCPSAMTRADSAHQPQALRLPRRFWVPSSHHSWNQAVFFLFPNLHTSTSSSFFTLVPRVVSRVSAL